MDPSPLFLFYTSFTTGMKFKTDILFNLHLECFMLLSPFVNISKALEKY